MANHQITDVKVTDKHGVIDVNIEEASKAEPTPKIEDVKPPEIIDAPARPATVEPDDDGDDASSIPRPDNPIRLNKPIKINGEMVREFEWTEDITGDQFLAADDLAHTRSDHVSFGVAELDNAFHLAIGKMMIVAANQRVDIKDLDQVVGRDLIKLMRLGRFFTIQSDE